MKLLLFASLGGAIGAGLRFLINQAFAGPHLGAAVKGGAIAFPWSTVVVNVVGGLAMGIAFVVIHERLGGHPEWRAFVATGILGGFTTFSAYSLDMMHLMADGGLNGRFFAYTIGTVIAAFAALVVGIWLARGVLS